MKKTWQELAKAKMTELNISQERLGEMVGKTQGAIGHWLNGRREPSVEDIAAIMKALHMDAMTLTSDGQAFIPSPGDEMEYAGKIRHGLVPVRGEAILGTDGMVDMVEDHSGWLKIYSDDPDAYGLKVKGDSMWPRIKSGEYVLIEPNSPVAAGDEVFVRTHEGHNMIKMIGFKRDGVYQFVSINQDHRPFTIEASDVDHVRFVAGILKASRYIDNDDIEDLRH